MDFAYRGLFLARNPRDKWGFSVHKLVSNYNAVMEAYPPKEHAQKQKNLEHRILGLTRLCLLISLLSTPYREMCVFSGTSTMAISVVSYLRAIDDEGPSHLGFCMVKSKLVRHHSHTLHRLELCGAALSVELADELDIKKNKNKKNTTEVFTVQLCQHWPQPCQPWYATSNSFTSRTDKLTLTFAHAENVSLDMDALFSPQKWSDHIRIIWKLLSRLLIEERSVWAWMCGIFLYISPKSRYVSQH